MNGPGERWRLVLRGVVQGVGFRPFVYGLAVRHGLSGWVANDASGVVIEVEGPPEALAAFAGALRAEAPPLSRILEFRSEPAAPTGEHGFRVDASRAGAGHASAIPADVAVCAACLREMRDPADRRFRYPFINCTDCGPRYTIVLGVPYDRPRTTMAAFPMCPACAAEYADPATRRFHAQPNACPDCGPRIWLERADTAVPELDPPRAPLPAEPPPVGEAALAAAMAALRAGEIVAVKGVGGFHLACDARREEAVRRLRQRKHRPHKPLAVMARDLHAARAFARVSPAEARALEGRERPIVLLRARAEPAIAIAPSVAPGLNRIGVMLPYSPLHHLLADAMPLVLTSGNLSDEPIEIENRSARRRLGPIADAFLLHDRPIRVSCDDSVLRVVEERELPIRRSRGYAPLPVVLPGDGPSVLAVGADLKATFCLTQGDRAYLSQHLGDQENYETQRAFADAVAHVLAAYDGRPDRVACDLHPGYFSTGWAERWASDHAVPVRRVQHHHAHIAAVTAEHAWPPADPVLGVAFDGTGFGPDGAIWGGELLRATSAAYRRLAHLGYVPLPGGDAAIRHPRRVALAHLRAAGAEWDERLPCVTATPVRERRILARQLETGLGCVPTSSAGRLFDAIASLLGVRHEAAYEAQAAMELEALAEDQSLEPYAAETGGDGILDPGPLVLALARDFGRGARLEELAGRAHGTIIALVVNGCRHARERGAPSTVALGGGVFQNAVLLAALPPLLRAEGFDVLVPQRVPPNDGGIALGQAEVARAC